jgi:hypothetical protein
VRFSEQDRWCEGAGRRDFGFHDGPRIWFFFHRPGRVGWPGSCWFCRYRNLVSLHRGSGLNGARFGAIGVVAAVLVKQPCEVHVCTTPRGGKGQQPIKAAHRAPIRNGLINCFRAGKIPFPAFPEGDNEAMKINDENRRAVWR